jgi:DNA-binding beta-propeller fold protein YncE
MVLATVLGTNRPAHAAPPPTAVSVAISPASGHLFVVSEILGESWVSMLDAHTGKVLHAVPVPTGTSQILVDDRSGHAFLCSRDATVMLSTRSGRIVADLTWTSGNADMQALAGRLGFLYVTADSRLHQIDTRTGRELRSVPLSNQPFASVAVHEGTGRVFTLDGAGVLRIYDARTLQLVQQITVGDPPPAFTLPLAPVLTAAENENTVLLTSGQSRQNLMVLDAATGAELRTVRVPVPIAVAVALDAKTSRAFVVSTGNAGEPPYANGVVTTIDVKTGTVLQTVEVGVGAAGLAVDPSTDHLFVLSLPPVGDQGAIDYWSASVSMIDTRTGSLLLTTPIPQTVLAAARLAVDGADHRVYVSWATSQGNSLTVLDSRTNALLPRLFVAAEGGAAPWWLPVWRSTVRITAST